MILRWCIYLVALVGCIVFWVAHQGWLPAMLFWMAAFLPLFSLLMSLPSMIFAKPELLLPPRMQIGEKETVILRWHRFTPLSYRCRLTMVFNGETTSKITPGDAISSEHCGQIRLAVKCLAVYDLLGLFRRKFRKIPEKSIPVYPLPIQTVLPESLQRTLSTAWKPKYGGGFAENYEIRMYQPGDGLNQLHWKLTAKTGKLMVRQPIIPEKKRLDLPISLGGTPEERDKNCGELYWLCQNLLDQGISFSICPEGSAPLPVETDPQLTQAMDKLLTEPWEVAK